ncbi:WYL domain-containing protein [Pantoea eucrina]|uniref:WYL domain-containing protein n=1 Tax=Pantoea eucrina TaxID=472693 RepID=UPI0028B88270|nr:WYL domain-containing protein [Yersinia enterocolitica]ELI8442340.1 WYL domain-containing protein [Yersinia enterocolitica]
MCQAERRYDKLAIRLSLIISRLVAGETLNLSKLAVEFGVSVRTLRRDFRERLIYLDLEYHNGNCRLLTGENVVRREHVALAFARQSGVAGLFPGLDHRLVNTLLESGIEAPCIVWQPASLMGEAHQGLFQRITSAITGRRRITVLAEGHRCEQLAPYRLISLEGCWYLTGELRGHISVFTLTDIQTISVSNENFTMNEPLLTLISDSEFIRALPHFRFFQSLLAGPDIRPIPQKDNQQ